MDKVTFLLLCIFPFPKMCLTPAGEAVYEAALEIADAYSRVDEKLVHYYNEARPVMQYSD